MQLEDLTNAFFDGQAHHPLETINLGLINFPVPTRTYRLGLTEADSP